LQDPAKFIQTGIFGLKTNHLATLLGMELASKILLPTWRRVRSPSRHVCPLRKIVISSETLIEVSNNADPSQTTLSHECKYQGCQIYLGKTYLQVTKRQ
jgi:hypothetical protein